MSEIDPPSIIPNMEPIDGIRRDFIAECLDHVARMASNGCHAISLGDDKLYEMQIELMRLTLLAAMNTYKEMKAQQ